MSPTNEDNLGRRRFLLHRDKAVEHALERIRRAPDAGWENLEPGQRAGLKSVLTEIWESCERNRWQDFCFSTISQADILRLVAIADDMKSRHLPVCNASREIETILLSCGAGKRPQ